METYIQKAAADDFIYLIQNKPEKPPRETSFPYKTALMTAAAANATKSATVLLQTERRLQDAVGWTALHYAASNGCKKVIEILRDFESDVKSTREYLDIPADSTAYDVARLKHPDVLDDFQATTVIHESEEGHVTQQVFYEPMTIHDLSQLKKQNDDLLNRAILATESFQIQQLQKENSQLKTELHSVKQELQQAEILIEQQQLKLNQLIETNKSVMRYANKIRESLRSNEDIK